VVLKSIFFAAGDLTLLRALAVCMCWRFARVGGLRVLAVCARCKLRAGGLRVLAVCARWRFARAGGLILS
jgi:hypothetical protein